MFFIATAPEGGGHVNVSPKGLDSLRVLSQRELVYLDVTGSGAETIAHIRDNGRITVMWNAFAGPARIVRVYGEGHVHLPGSDRFEELVGLFEERRGIRSIISVDVERVQDSCGFGVPKMNFVENRKRMETWVGQRSDDEIAEYWLQKNATSIDGLPALD